MWNFANSSAFFAVKRGVGNALLFLYNRKERRGIRKER